MKTFPKGIFSRIYQISDAHRSRLHTLLISFRFLFAWIPSFFLRKYLAPSRSFLLYFLPVSFLPIRRKAGSRSVCMIDVRRSGFQLYRITPLKPVGRGIVTFVVHRETILSSRFECIHVAPQPPRVIL